MSKEIFTPRSLKKWIVDSLVNEKDLRPGNLILDPAAGSGNFLIGNPPYLEKAIAKKKITAKELYHLLTENILGKGGKITFDLNGILVTVKTKDIIGNVIQDWLGEWMKTKSIYFDVPESTQEFPDFFLDPLDKHDSLLEVKSFDTDASPNFDIANFESYCRSLKTKAYRLDADYIIFGYQTDKDGTITITDIWLKKIWEISCPSEAYPVKIQQKQSMIYNLRPATWYGHKLEFNPFSSRLKFVEALYETLIKYPKTAKDSKNWLNEVKKNYKEHTGKNL